MKQITLLLIVIFSLSSCASITAPDGQAFVDKYYSVSEEQLKNIPIEEIVYDFRRTYNYKGKTRRVFLDRLEGELKRRYGLSDKEISSAQEGKIFIGMTLVGLWLAWGTPKKINKSVGRWGVHRQHVYGNGQYVYSENNRITSWQQ